MKVKQTKFILRGLISIILLYYVISNANLNFIFEKIKNIRFSYYFLSQALEFLAIIITTWTWKLLLDAKTIPNSFSQLIRYNFTSRFFNTFLPTNIGGDIYRINQIRKDLNAKNDSVATVLIQRLFGVVALFSISIVSMFFLKDQLSSNLQLIIYVFFLILIFSITVLFNKKIGKKLKPYFGRIKILNINKHLTTFHHTLNSFKQSKVTLLKAALSALTFHLILIVKFYFISLALNINVPFTWFLMYIPLIKLILFLPISINGIGLKENAFIFFFARTELSSAEAVSISLFSYLYILINATIGMILFNARKKN